MEPIQLSLGKTFVKGEALAVAQWSVPTGKLLVIEHFSAFIDFGNAIEKVNFFELQTQVGMGNKSATHRFAMYEQHSSKGVGRFVVNQPIRTYATALTNVVVRCGRDIGTSAGSEVTFVAAVVGQLENAP